MPNILITGGIGYVGLAVVARLHALGFGLGVLDNAHSGHWTLAGRPTLPLGVTAFAADLTDAAALARIFQAQRWDAVIHLAARCLVQESLAQPADYYATNVSGTWQLIQAMRAHGVQRMVFASSCAVYGKAVRLPIDESHPLAPVNPYGWSKRIAEQMLADLGAAGELKSIVLRTFNAAGADLAGRWGEWHEPETHALPRLLRAASGQAGPFPLYGTDFPTLDGTAIRDYVHVLDLAEAHALALQALLADDVPHRTVNLGSGRGESLAGLIQGVEAVCGQPVPVVHYPRRPEDPACLIADNRRARQALGWEPQYSERETIIRSAWAWEQTRQALCRPSPVVELPPRA